MTKELRAQCTSISGANNYARLMVNGRVTEGTAGTVGRHVGTEMEPPDIAMLLHMTAEQRPAELARAIRQFYMYRSWAPKADNELTAKLRKFADLIDPPTVP